MSDTRSQMRQLEALETALLEACMKGDIRQVDEISSRLGGNHEWLLSTAARSGQLQMVKHLVAQGQNHFQEAFVCTSLAYLDKGNAGNLEVMHYLLYELKLDVHEDTKKSLQNNLNEHDYQHLLKMIEKRDLHLKKS